MASIIPNEKDGKLVSYKFKICLGRDEFGKQINRCTTWRVPKNLSPSKIQKAVVKAANEWEAQVRDEYKKDLEFPELVKEREIVNARTEFSYFVNEIWFPIAIDDGEHKPTSIDFYRNISKVIANYFHGKAIQSITGIDIQRYLTYLRTKYKSPQGKPLKPKSVRHHYCTLANIFSFAIKHEVLLKNPMDSVDCPKVPKKKVDALTKEQAQTFFILLNDCPLDFRCMMNLLITTGVRRGELTALQWQDIDFENLTISISRNVTYTPDSGVVVGSPKTDCGIRTIPLLPSVATLLIQHRDSTNTWYNTDFIFSKPGEPTQARRPDTVTRQVKSFMKKHGLGDMSPHDLRHTCATMLLESGADVKSVAEILGHSDASVTLNYYVRSDIGQMRTATNKFADAFNL